MPKIHTVFDKLKRIFTNNEVSAGKIGVLYICTGKYNIFWERFYRSCKKHFCKSSEVHFFVFSDQPVNTFDDSNVHVCFQNKLGWPFDTLNRFHIFLSQKHEIAKMNYLFYFNANMVFVGAVNERMILPDRSKFPSNLVAVLHPCHYDRQPVDLIYDRNPQSTAYIAEGDGEHYYQGCLSGGGAEEYLQMCEQLSKNIDKDLSKDVIALWHDESHINHYFLSHRPRPLHPGFAYPENMKVPFRRYIVQVDKSKAGGHEFLRS